MGAGIDLSADGVSQRACQGSLGFYALAMDIPEPAPIFQERTDFALGRLTDLQARVNLAAEGVSLTGLSIFTVGSYGRLEPSSHSDIDLFFIYEEESPKDTRRTSELKLFGRLIEIVERMDFPALSNDAQYLESHVIEEVLENLGSPSDDARNFFTMRMLLLLESRPVYGNESYLKVITQIVDSYYRDYPAHEASFRPWFLLNDIMRFWKTLLLNYEHKRNRPDDNPDDPKPRVKNFKLKFSRATTCFATICAIGSSTTPVSSNDILELVSITPRERLARVSQNIPATGPLVQAVLDEYAWFLEQTGLPTEQLDEMFLDRDQKRAVFGRADAYGAKLYALLKAIDDETDGQLLRALVV